MQKIAIAILLGLMVNLQQTYGQQKSANGGPLEYADLVLKEYGLDQELVNGVQYYNRYLRSMGHPYFLDNDFRNGTLIIRGRIYRNVQLKYDIHSQHVELGYENFSGGSNQIVTVHDLVDEFYFGEFRFAKLRAEGEEDKYYQVIETSCFTCYIYWEKGLVPMSGNTAYTEQFTDPKRTFFIGSNGKTGSFSSKKDFAEYFPEDRRKEIKKVLNKNQFSFRNASPAEIIRQMTAVCNLFEKDKIQ